MLTIKIIELVNDKGSRNIDFNKLLVEEFCFTTYTNNLHLIKEIFL